MLAAYLEPLKIGITSVARAGLFKACLSLTLGQAKIQAIIFSLTKKSRQHCPNGQQPTNY